MPKQIRREEIGDGIFFTSVEEKKFKTMRLSVHFIMPLAEETAFDYAMVPNLLRKGGAEYPTFKELNQKLDDLYGAVLYTDVRKSGDQQILTLSLQTIAQQYALENEKVEEECTKLLLSLIVHPLVDNEAFQKDNFEIEKNALTDQILSEMNDKRLFAVRKTVEYMFAGDPHGIPVCGRIEDAARSTPASVYAAYRNILNTGRIEILCSGNCDAKKIKDVFSSNFEGIHRCSTPSTPRGFLQPVPTPFSHEETQSVLQSKLVMGFSSESEDELALRVAVALFGGTVTSKLFMNVREKMSLCYYCAARWDQTKRYMLVDSGVANENVTKTSSEILHQLQMMQDGDVSQQEVEETLSYLSNSLLSVEDSLSGIELWYITRILLGDLITPEEQIDRFREITRERLISAAKSMGLHTTFVLKGEDENA